ncbi:MAG: ABC transporter ATP-binding protein [Candidatus Aenigmatarchaeota archaeon]|nr:MAG: ABC transporter ATP-binding protein [Candidatus Aenigmarchaeota archaeon]
MPEIIKIKDVSKSYPKETYNFSESIKNFFKREKKVVLDDISFSVKKGEIFGLLGPNGAGKTTLFKIITNLLRADKGEVYLFGEKIPENYKKVASKINTVFARANLWWELKGKENLKVYGKIYRVKNLEEKIDSLLDFFDLKEKANRYTDLYSTGEIMRLCIAKSLLNDPELLILDEPTIGLDPNIALKIREFLKELNRKRKTTIFLSTHYMEEADMLCNKVALINEGKIIKIDSPTNLKEILKKEEIIELRLEKFSFALLKKLEKMKFVKKSYFIEETERVRILIDDINNLDKLIREIKKYTKIQNFVVSQPTLQDVFIHFTGKEVDVR